MFLAGAEEDTIHLFRALNRMQKGFAAGVLHQNDLLFALGRAMGIPVVSQKPYLPVEPAQADRAFSMAMGYDLIVAADLPDGALLEENRLLIQRLIRAGKPVVSTKEYQARLAEQL